MVPLTKTEKRDGPLQAEIAHGVSDELRLQARLALPMIATYVAELCMWYVDHAIVGRLGGVELAAVGLSGLFFWQLIVIGMAILSIVGVIVGNAHGAGDVALVGRGVRQGLWSAVALSLPIMVLCWFLMDVLALTGQDPRIIALGEEYVRASVWVIPPSLGFVALRSFVVGVSRPLVITVLVFLTIPLNFLLSYGLVFGELGMPLLGVAGAGYATSVVGWLMFIALIVYIGRHATLRRYQIFRGLLSLDGVLWRRIWRLGLPVAGMTIVEGSQFQVMTLLVGLFGAVTLAAHQVVVNAVSLGFMVALGLGEAATVRVAQEMGASRPLAARRAGWMAIAGGALVGLGSAVVLWATPEIVAGVFLDLRDPDNAEIVGTVRQLALIGAAMAVVDLTLIVVGRCLRGLEDTVIPMVIIGVGSWLFAMPLGAFFAFGLGQGAAGMWWGLALGLAVTCLLMLWRWQVLTRRA